MQGIVLATGRRAIFSTTGPIYRLSSQDRIVRVVTEGFHGREHLPKSGQQNNSCEAQDSGLSW
jgi:hypothetical protein